MSFGVLTTSPRRFTLTEAAVFPPPTPRPDQNTVPADNTPLQAPQPQKSSAKIRQLTGYDLSSPVLRRNVSARIEDANDDESDDEKTGIANEDQKGISSTGSIRSSKSSSSTYSYDNNIDKAIRRVSEWGSWGDSDYLSISRRSRGSFYGLPQTHSTSTSELVPLRADAGTPLSLRTRDRSNIPAHLVVTNGSVEHSRSRTRSLEDIGLRDRPRQFSFEDNIVDGCDPFRTSSEVYQTNGSNYDASLRMSNSVDPAHFIPAGPISLALWTRNHDSLDISRFSDHSSESEASRFSNARPSVMSGMHALASPFRLARPTSLFREKAIKPASLRMPSPTFTYSSHQSKTSQAGSRFSTRTHPLISNFPIPTSTSKAYINPSEASSQVSPSDEETYMRRLSSAFKSLNSPLSSSSFSPDSPSTSSRFSDIIKERIIFTDKRKPGGPDTPYPTKNGRRGSYGPSTGEKLSHVAEDASQAVGKGAKKVWGKVKDVTAVVSDLSWETKSGKPDQRYRSGAVRGRNSLGSLQEAIGMGRKDRDKARRERLIQSIRVVKKSEVDSIGAFGFEVEPVKEAKDRMDLWV